MWVLLLEKVFAKVYGSYNAIEAGNPMNAIRNLTGAPGANKYLSKFSLDELWDLIYESY